jgi:hypothetical protein
MDEDIRQMTLEQAQEKLQEIRDVARWWASQQGDPLSPKLHEW